MLPICMRAQARADVTARKESQRKKGGKRESMQPLGAHLCHHVGALGIVDPRLGIHPRARHLADRCMRWRAVMGRACACCAHRVCGPVRWPAPHPLCRAAVLSVTVPAVVLLTGVPACASKAGKHVQRACAWLVKGARVVGVKGAAGSSEPTLVCSSTEAFTASRTLGRASRSWEVGENKVFRVLHRASPHFQGLMLPKPCLQLLVEGTPTPALRARLAPGPRPPPHSPARGAAWAPRPPAAPAAACGTRSRARPRRRRRASPRPRRAAP